MIIGDRYFIDNPEAGYYECSKEYYESFHKRREALMAMVSSRILSTNDNIKGGFIFSSVRPLGDDNHEDFRKLWMEYADKTDDSRYKYFQPAYPDSKFDKYGYAILPTGLREITDDAISTARLQFPKSEDEAF